MFLDGVYVPQEQKDRVRPCASDTYFKINWALPINEKLKKSDLRVQKYALKTHKDFKFFTGMLAQACTKVISSMKMLGKQRKRILGKVWFRYPKLSWIVFTTR